MNYPHHQKLICLRETWGHMSSVSGFDPLFSAVSNSPCISANSYYVELVSTAPTFPQKLFHAFGLGPLVDEVDPLNPSYMERRHIQAVLKVLLHAQSEKEALIFLSAAENQYCRQLSNTDDSVRRRIVLFLHQPPSWFNKHWGDFKVFNGLRALVCLSEEQKEYFSSLASSPVVRIYHGVQHNFFVPRQDSQITPWSLLFVGQWLRDFETLCSAMLEIWKARPEVTLDCVVPSRVRDNPGFAELLNDNRVSWHESIEPEALRNLYQKATLLFLPLIDSAANNALLEALACGLPIVTSDVGGVRDYLNDNCAVLCPAGDVNAHASAVIESLEDDEFMSAASRESRKLAVQCFDWTAIAEDLLRKLGLHSGT